MKRVFDFILVLFTMPIWLFLMLVIAIAIFINMGAPILFLQLRAGRDGRIFRFMKFRTMRQEEGDDISRTTPIGSFLRRTSLDELPQLFHVLSGKMSLVGPRALPARYLSRYSKFQARRHEVLPGITGWAQVNGRNSLSWDEKFSLDVWYVDNRSFLLDLKIIFLTFSRLFKQNGINHSARETMTEFLGTKK